MVGGTTGDGPHRWNYWEVFEGHDAEGLTGNAEGVEFKTHEILTKMLW